MRDVKKLVEMSLGINVQKATLLKNSEPPYTLCEACIIGKHHRTPRRVINRIDLYKQSTKIKELSHDDLAGAGKITRTLRGSCTVFGLRDDLTYLTEINLLRKKSETCSQLKK